MRVPKEVKLAAISRGRCAKIRGEGKKDNPFDAGSPYFELWLDGWYSVEVRKRGRDEEGA